MVGKVKFMLTDAQIRKIGTAFKRHDGVTLKLNSALISPSGVPIVLTEHEKQLLRDGMNHNIHISFTRLKEMGSSWVRSGSKIGGILPLIPIIIGALTAAGLAGGAAASIASTVKTAKSVGNEKRITDAHIENERRKTDAFIAAAQAKEKQANKEAKAAKAAKEQAIQASQIAQAVQAAQSVPAATAATTGTGLHLSRGRGKNGGFLPLTTCYSWRYSTLKLL